MASIPIDETGSLPPVPWRSLPGAWLHYLAFRYLPFRCTTEWFAFAQRLANLRNPWRKDPRFVAFAQDLLSSIESARDRERAMIRNRVLCRVGRNTFAPVFHRTRSDLIEFLRPKGLETLDKLKEDGEGTIILQGHFGYNAWCGPALIGMGYPVHLMQRHHISPNKLLMFRRAQWGDRVVRFPEPGMEGMHLKKLHDMLRGGAWIQHVAEKPAPDSGVEGELFGHRIRCFRTPWTLAKLSKCPAVPVMIVADRKMQPEMLVGPAIRVGTGKAGSQSVESAFHCFLRFLEQAMEGRRWNFHPKTWDKLRTICRPE